MPATMEIIRPGEIDQWDQALYAFLAEKERRSGSRRTVESYSRMLQHFFGSLAKTSKSPAPRCSAGRTASGCQAASLRPSRSAPDSHACRASTSSLSAWG